jgi:hypothetical protein
VFVAAAGNAHGDIDLLPANQPALYNDAVITVSGLAQSSAVPLADGLLSAPCIDPQFPESGVLVENSFTSVSNFGREIDIAAPACNVATSIPTFKEFWEHWLRDQDPMVNKNQLPYYYPHAFGNGTSIATPMVVAGVALWINKYRDAYDRAAPGDRLALVLYGDPGMGVPGLVDLAEHIVPGTCEHPPEAGCPHYNYALGPDGLPITPPVHPEPVLDVSALLDL